MSLGYGDDSSCGIENTSGRQRQFNGNVNWLMWTTQRSTGNAPLQGLKFSYDGADRLVTSQSVTYQSPCSAGWQAVAKFSETFSYDGNGNMLALTRNDGNGTAIDNLTYNYTANTNQVNFITDASGNAACVMNGQTSNNYTYDANGNLTSDYSKGILSIVYDWRNLPLQTTKSVR